MANKKISQLTEVGNVGVGDLFAVAVPAGGPYITKSCEPKAIATYALNPVPSDIPTIGFTGTQNVFFDKSNWIDTSDAGTHAFVMVNKDNGQLTTGSGIGVVANGDNMGNCVATTDINMQGFDITGLDDVEFKNNESHPTSFISNVYTAGKLRVQAGNDLWLSGKRHISISGQALSLEDGDTQTPISGNVTITGGDLEIDPGNKLTTNQIQVDGTASDYGSIEMSVGAIKPYSQALGALTNVNWAGANISHIDRTDDTTIKFYNVKDGQTYTMYMKNTDTNNPTSGNFLYTMGTSVSDATTGVHWGEVYDGTQQGYVRAAPTIAKEKTNIYTFVCIETGVFASAVTGYAY